MPAAAACGLAKSSEMRTFKPARGHMSTHRQTGAISRKRIILLAIPTVPILSLFCLRAMVHYKYERARTSGYHDPFLFAELLKHYPKICNSQHRALGIMKGLVALVFPAGESSRGA
jgi:hypothetical protein